jgi:hypothetical protein
LFSAFPSGTDNSLISDEIEEQRLRKITKKKKGKRWASTQSFQKKIVSLLKI